MNFLPIFLNVKDKLCLVVGGGAVARRKASLLLNAGARVKVVAPELSATFTGIPGIEHVAEYFQSAHLDGAALVVAATGDSSVNQDVSQQARAIFR